MKKILLVCPRTRDLYELSRPEITNGHQIIFHAYDPYPFRQFNYPTRQGQPLDITMLLKDVVNQVRKEQVDAIISTEDYIGSIVTSLAAQACNLSAPSIHTMLTCQHKYHARVAQKKSVAHAVPAFTAIHKTKKLNTAQLTFPLFVKPAKSSFSIGAQKVSNVKQLSEAIHQLVPPKPYLAPLSWSLKHYTNLDPATDYLVGEELLEGIQTTVDGFVANGQVTVQGIVDSIMYPETISFARFDYPSKLPAHIQQKMIEITQQCMSGIEFDHGCFNIEYMYNPATDRISIIEINPRMARQFADLFEKVDGINTYRRLVDLVTNHPLTPSWGKGPYAAASIYVLRLKDDHYIHALPTEAEISQVQRQFPGTLIDITVTINKKLSDSIQDGLMYRYACIHVGGQDQQDLDERFKQILKMLTFDLKPVK